MIFKLFTGMAMFHIEPVVHYIIRIGIQFDMPADCWILFAQSYGCSASRVPGLLEDGVGDRHISARV